MKGIVTLLCIIGVAMSSCRLNNCQNCEKTPPPPPPIITQTFPLKWQGPRMLSYQEMHQTLADHFQIDIKDQIAGFPVESPGVAFYNSYRPLVSPVWFSKYFEATYTISEKILEKNPFDKTYFHNCDIEIACVGRMLDDLGLLMLRRPLTQEESRDYGTLFSDYQGTVREKVKIVLAAFLQSPQFLYVVETSLPNSNQLDPYSLLTRLSLFFYGATPGLESLKNKDLLKDLETHKGVLKAGEAMLSEEKADRGFVSFVDSWLGLDQIELMEKNIAVFPIGTPEDLRNFRLEIVYNLLDSRKKGEDLRDFLFTERTIVNRRIADFYGVPFEGEGFQPVSLASQKNRFGYFSSGAFASLLSVSIYTRATSRGLYVMRTFLCKDVPPPPPGFGAFDEGIRLQVDKLSHRQLLEMHLTNPSCHGCHDLMDPIGFALENYNPVGEYRTKERQYLIDATGKLESNGKTIAFANAREMAKIIRDDSRVPTCLARKTLQFAVGRATESLDSASLAKLAAELANDKVSYRQLFLKTLENPDFIKNFSALE